MTAKAGKSRSAEIPPPIFTVRSLEEVLAQQQAQHSAMISLIIKNTGKIQKEIGFRRPRLKVNTCAIFLVHRIVSFLSRSFDLCGFPFLGGVHQMQ